MRLGSWVLVGTWLVGSAALGGGVGVPNLAARVRAADRVVVAAVGDARVEDPAGDPHRIETVTEISVLENVKGTGPSRIRLEQLGGADGPWQLRVSGQPRLSAGELVLLFLRCRDPKRPAHCTLWGGPEGKLDLSERDDGVEAVVRTRAGAEPTRVPLGKLVDAIREIASRGAR